MTIARYNQSTGTWEPMDGIPSNMDARLTNLEQTQGMTQNFLTNSSFEQWSPDSPTAGTPTGWDTSASAGTNHTFGNNTTVRTGSCSFRVSFSTLATTVDYRRLQSAAMPCVPGQWWDVSYWVYCTHAGREASQLTMHFGTDTSVGYGNGTTTTSLLVNQSLGAGHAGVWTLISTRVQVPVGKTYMKLAITASHIVAAGTASAVNVDDASMRLVDMGSAAGDVVMAPSSDLVFTPSVGAATILASDAVSTPNRNFLQVKSGAANPSYLNLYGAEDVSASTSTIALGVATATEMVVKAGAVDARDFRISATPQSVAGSSLPRGNVGSISIVAAHATTDAAGAYVDSLLTLTYNQASTPLRILRAYIVAHVRSNVAGDRITVALREGASTVLGGYTLQQPQNASTITSLSFCVDLTPSTGSHTYKVSFVRAGGTGTVTFDANATAKGLLSIDDIGV